MNTPSRRRPTKATQTNVLRTAFRSAPSADTIDFQSFVSNHPNRVSNTFTGWYQVPLFVFTCQLARKLRSPDGTSGRTHRIAFRMGDSDRVFEVDVTPAQILSRDGANQSVHYPGASEERILEVLFRLAARPGHGVSALGMFAAVRFTYAMLHDELARHGHEMSHRQLSLSLQVLNQSRMVIRDPKDKEPIYSGSAIPQIVRDNASDDGREVMLIAEFAAPIATLIGRAAYRQIDYERLMQIRHPVARYLYKRLVHRYTYADMINTYHFRFSAIRGAGTLDSYSSRVDKQRPVVKAALDGLAGLGVIRDSYEVKLHYAPQGRRSIEDVTYTLAATKQFVTEQKAASRRSKDAAAHRPTPIPRRAFVARKPVRIDHPAAEVPWGIA